MDALPPNFHNMKFKWGFSASNGRKFFDKKIKPTISRQSKTWEVGLSRHCSYATAKKPMSERPKTVRPNVHKAKSTKSYPERKKKEKFRLKRS